MFRTRSLVALAGLLLVALVALAPAVSAQTGDPAYPLDSTPPTVLDNEFQKGNPPAAKVLSKQTLPVTGSDVVGLAAIGLVTVGAGLALVRYQRRTAAQV